MWWPKIDVYMSHVSGLITDVYIRSEYLICSVELLYIKGQCCVTCVSKTNIKRILFNY